MCKVLLGHFFECCLIISLLEMKDDMLLVSETQEQISVLEVVDLTQLEVLVLLQSLQALISRNTFI